MSAIRHDWTLIELQKIYEMPLLSLIALAGQLHTQYHDRDEVQVCHLISVKTGGCPEDCNYCPQSSRYRTHVEKPFMMTYEEVIAVAKRAVNQGATRICLGAAWRQVRDNKQFDEILRMVKGITDLGAEVCCTLGMLTPPQARRLKEAGLYSYNHNLDSSERFYPQVTTTRLYQDRLDTLDVVQQTGLGMCCGGILGMGETKVDRLEMLLTLCRRQPHPDSVPINRLVAVAGTPFEGKSMATVWELARMVATARIAMPKAMVRLSAGRMQMSYEAQTLCFLAGANSIHSGERLLTLPNGTFDKDREMFQILGLKPQPPFKRIKDEG